MINVSKHKSKIKVALLAGHRDTYSTPKPEHAHNRFLFHRSTFPQLTYTSKAPRSMKVNFSRQLEQDLYKKITFYSLLVSQPIVSKHCQ